MAPRCTGMIAFRFSVVYVVITAHRQLQPCAIQWNNFSMTVDSAHCVQHDTSAAQLKSFACPVFRPRCHHFCIPAFAKPRQTQATSNRFSYIWLNPKTTVKKLSSGNCCQILPNCMATIGQFAVDLRPATDNRGRESMLS